MNANFLSVAIFLCLSFALKGQGTGPNYIKNNLTGEGVFDVPGFEFTSDYDSYNPHSNIQGLLMDGLDYMGNPTKVFCWYGIPESLMPGETAPAVVLMHGGGGDAFTAWVKKWTDRGYIAISIALEGQVPDGNPNWQYSGPERIDFFTDVLENLSDQWFYHAVADAIMANSLLRSFPEVDADKIGITGISWGGILSNVITGIDNRFSFHIPVYGCGYLDTTPLFGYFLDTLSEAHGNAYLNNWEPSLYVPFQNQPTLYVNGTNDPHFSMNAFTKTYKASGNEKYLRIEHNMEHGHPPGWAPVEIYDFADYITKGAQKPLTFTNTIVNNGQVSYEYTFDGTVNQALLYYTTDTADWQHDNYEWLSLSANLNTSAKVATAQIPNDAVAYFMNINDTISGLMYSSVIKTDIERCINIDLYAYLEGAYNAASSEMTTELNTRGLLPGQTPISDLVTPTPAGQPYNAAPWNYAGTEGIGWKNADYTGDETDWILVSFRTGTAKSTEVGMTAGLLMKDGSIKFPDSCVLTSAVASPLYIVLEHRNHMGVMTPQPIDAIDSTLTYDFRLADSYRDPTSFGQKQIPTGEWVLYAGDADQSDFPSYDILGADKSIWVDNNGAFDYYLSPDFNLDGDVNGQDKSLWFENNGISSRVPK